MQAWVTDLPISSATVNFDSRFIKSDDFSWLRARLTSTSPALFATSIISLMKIFMASGTYLQRTQPSDSVTHKGNEDAGTFALG